MNSTHYCFSDSKLQHRSPPITSINDSSFNTTGYSVSSHYSTWSHINLYSLPITPSHKQTKSFMLVITSHLTWSACLWKEKITPKTDMNNLLRYSFDGELISLSCFIQKLGSALWFIVLLMIIPSSWYYILNSISSSNHHFSMISVSICTVDQ